MSVIANKAYALSLGPSGVGVIAVILATLMVGAVVTTNGLGISVVQLASAARASGERQSALDAENAARVLSLCISVPTALVLVIWRDQIGTLLFGDPRSGAYLLFVAPAIVFTSLAYVETGVLTGQERLREIAAGNLVAAAAGAIAGISGVLLAGVDGFAVAVLLTAACHYAFVAWRTNGMRLGPTGLRPPAGPTSFRLMRLGLPASASQLGLVGAPLLIQVMTLHFLGEHDVGLYRAASTISIAYLTLVLSTISYEFLPRMTRTSDRDAGAAIDRHMRLLLGLALPAIVGLFALGPVALRVLYSAEFSDAIVVLQWLLVGDLLRLPAWALSYALLSQGLGRMFSAVELIGGLAVVAALPIGLLRGGLEGVGVGYAVAQAVYLIAAWWVVWRRGITLPGRLQGLVVAVAGLVAATIVVGASLEIRGLLFGAAAIVLAALAAPRLIAMLRTPDK